MQQQQTPSIPCKFYIKGICKNKTDCKFSHAKEHMPLCNNYFTNHYCINGESCKFRHQIDNNTTESISKKKFREMQKEEERKKFDLEKQYEEADRKKKQELFQFKEKQAKLWKKWIETEKTTLLPQYFFPNTLQTEHSFTEDLFTFSHRPLLWKQDDWIHCFGMVQFPNTKFAKDALFKQGTQVLSFLEETSLNSLMAQIPCQSQAFHTKKQQWEWKLEEQDPMHSMFGFQTAFFFQQKLYVLLSMPDFIYIYDFAKKRWKTKQTIRCDTLPTYFYKYTAVVHQNEVIIYGGLEEPEESPLFSKSDMFSLNLETMRWKSIVHTDLPSSQETSDISTNTTQTSLQRNLKRQTKRNNSLVEGSIVPYKLSSHTSLLRSTPNGNYMIVYGGIEGLSLTHPSNHAALNGSVFEFNFETLKWSTLYQHKSALPSSSHLNHSLKPCSRCDHAAVLVPSQEKMIIFGGTSSSLIRTAPASHVAKWDLLNDCWEFNFVTKQFSRIWLDAMAIEYPLSSGEDGVIAARKLHGMFWDECSHQLFTYGGVTYRKGNIWQPLETLEVFKLNFGAVEFRGNMFRSISFFCDVEILFAL